MSVLFSLIDAGLAFGAHPLLDGAAFTLTAGERLGLIGRNGTGKSSLLNVIAGRIQLDDGRAVVRDGLRIVLVEQEPVLPPAGTLFESLLARGTAAGLVDERDERRYWALQARLRAELDRFGVDQEVDPEGLSGGQNKRAALALAFALEPDLLLLDEPTNHLDADSITWLKGYLQGFGGGLVVISHDVGLLEAVVNKVFHLDANRAELDLYAMDWKRYLQQRETDEKRRKRERLNAERKASQLMAQADRMRAKATKAVAAQNMAKRAEKLLSGIEGEREHDKVARIRFPDPAPCGKTPLMAHDLSKAYGSLEVFTAVDLAIDKGSKVVILGLNGAGKTTMLRLLAGLEEPDVGERVLGHGARLGYYAQEHETLDTGRTVLENMVSASPDMGDVEVRKVLGSFLFSGDDVDKPARVLSGGEKTRLALAMLVVSASNVLLLDEPTNNLDPASRAEVLSALRSYSGAVVLVTHDPGAVEALEPDRVLVLPDGVEDLWSDDYAELITLA